MIPGSGRSPGEGHGNPLHYSCLENPHGQRSLADYSPCSRKESDKTEVTEQAHRIFSCCRWDRDPESGIEPGPPVLGAQSLNPWTTRDIPGTVLDGEDFTFMDFSGSFA